VSEEERKGFRKNPLAVVRVKRGFCLKIFSSALIIQLPEENDLVLLVGHGLDLPCGWLLPQLGTQGSKDVLLLWLSVCSLGCSAAL
jgi:hypothetical protein